MQFHPIPITLLITTIIIITEIIIIILINWTMHLILSRKKEINLNIIRSYLWYISNIYCVCQLSMLPDQVITCECEELTSLVRPYQCHFNVLLISYICYTFHKLRRQIRINSHLYFLRYNIHHHNLYHFLWYISKKQ